MSVYQWGPTGCWEEIWQNKKELQIILRVSGDRKKTDQLYLSKGWVKKSAGKIWKAGSSNICSIYFSAFHFLFPKKDADNNPFYSRHEWIGQFDIKLLFHLSLLEEAWRQQIFIISQKRKAFITKIALSLWSVTLEIQPVMDVMWWMKRNNMLWGEKKARTAPAQCHVAVGCCAYSLPGWPQTLTRSTFALQSGWVPCSSLP